MEYAALATDASKKGVCKLPHAIFLSSTSCIVRNCSVDSSRSVLLNKVCAHCVRLCGGTSGQSSSNCIGYVPVTFRIRIEYCASAQHTLVTTISKTASSQSYPGSCEHSSAAMSSHRGSRNKLPMSRWISSAFPATSSNMCVEKLQ